MTKTEMIEQIMDDGGVTKEQATAIADSITFIYDIKHDPEPDPEDESWKADYYYDRWREENR